MSKSVREQKRERKSLSSRSFASGKSKIQKISEWKNSIWLVEDAVLATYFTFSNVESLTL